jgi:hypothetical protein
MIKTSPQTIPTEWTIRPDLKLKPLRKHRAILWQLAHLVYYGTQNNPHNTLQDYADFLHRARWKAQTQWYKEQKQSNIYFWQKCAAVNTTKYKAIQKVYTMAQHYTVTFIVILGAKQLSFMKKQVLCFIPWK